MQDVTNIVLAGLGGQGVLTASDIVAEAAFRAGYDVKKAEVHGMSQRGGSVTSDVRFGSRVWSPMVPDGEAGYLVALDATQVEPARHWLAPSGRLLACTAVDPASLPTARALNVAMMGMLSVFLRIPETAWIEAVRSNLAEKLHEVNLRAFEVGRVAGQREKEKGHA